jgi:hypothetical protein
VRTVVVVGTLVVVTTLSSRKCVGVAEGAADETATPQGVAAASRVANGPPFGIVDPAAVMQRHCVVTTGAVAVPVVVVVVDVGLRIGRTK